MYACLLLDEKCRQQKIQDQSYHSCEQTEQKRDIDTRKEKEGKEVDILKSIYFFASISQGVSWW